MSVEIFRFSYFYGFGFGLEGVAVFGFELFGVTFQSE